MGGGQGEGEPSSVTLRLQRRGARREGHPLLDEWERGGAIPVPQDGSCGRRARAPVKGDNPITEVSGNARKDH